MNLEDRKYLRFTGFESTLPALDDVTTHQQKFLHRHQPTVRRVINRLYGRYPAFVMQVIGFRMLHLMWGYVV